MIPLESVRDYYYKQLIPSFNERRLTSLRINVDDVPVEFEIIMNESFWATLKGPYCYTRKTTAKITSKGVELRSNYLPTPPYRYDCLRYRKSMYFSCYMLKNRITYFGSRKDFLREEIFWFWAGDHPNTPINTPAELLTQIEQEIRCVQPRIFFIPWGAMPWKISPWTPFVRKFLFLKAKLLQFFRNFRKEDYDPA